MSISVEIFDKFRFLFKNLKKSQLRSTISKKKSISVKNLKNLDFGQHIWKKNRFRCKISKISISVYIFEKLQFGSKISIIWISINIFEKIRFRFKISKISILVNICEKIRFRFNISNIWTSVNISVQIFENLYFGQHFRKNFGIIEKFEISISVNIFEKKIDFGSKFGKSRLRSKFSKKKFDFGSKLRKSRFPSTFWKKKIDLV